MDQCWMVSPKDRPTFSELRTKFDTLILAQNDHMLKIDLEIDSHNSYQDHLSSRSSENDNGSFAHFSNTDQSTLAKEIGSIGSSLAMGLEDTSSIHEHIPNPYVDTPGFSVSCNGANGAQDEVKQKIN